MCRVSLAWPVQRPDWPRTWLMQGTDPKPKMLTGTKGVKRPIRRQVPELLHIFPLAGEGARPKELSEKFEDVLFFSVSSGPGFVGVACFMRR